MQGYIDNDDSMTEAMELDMISIINTVSDQLLIRLIGDAGFIHEIVYDPYEEQVKEYERQMENGGLLDDWEQLKATLQSHLVTAEIQEDITRLNLDAKHFIHGSYYWVRKDVRDILLDIIVDGKSGSFFGEGFWRSPRDFWTPFVELLEDGTVDSMIEKEFTKRKINYIKI